MIIFSKRCAFDEGAAMTVVYKKAAPGISTGQEVIIATDSRTQRLLFHECVKINPLKKKCTIPLEIFDQNSEVVLRHDLSDPNITICSQSVLSLFADNFDFETRDDFIKGLLLDEILSDSIYVSILSGGEYAAKVKDWHTYQIVRYDIEIVFMKERKKRIFMKKKYFNLQ